VNPSVRGGPFGRRSPLQRGPFSTPKHKHFYNLKYASADRHRDATCQQLAPREMDLPLTRLIDQAPVLLGHGRIPDSGLFRLDLETGP
jgi:hypothetical protein